MKTKLLIAQCILFACTTHAETAYKLSEAIQKQLVTVKIAGAKPDTSGVYQSSHLGPCMALEIVSATNDAITINMDYGYKLEPDDTSLQTMIVTQTLSVKLQPKQKKNYRLYAMCTEASDGAPGPDRPFKWTKRATGNLLDLAKLVNDNKYQTDAAQQAVWCLTNNHDLSNIVSDDTTMMYTLRRFVAKVKGIPVSKIYEAAGITAPTTYTTSITYSGELTYSFSNTAKVLIALFDEDNHMKKVYVNNEQQRPGEYSYKYQISSDEMGGKKYFLRMFRNGKMEQEISLMPRD